MVNRGSGGPRRPAPPAPRPQAPQDEGEEKTSAINLSEIDLDAIDAAPARPAPAAARPVPGRPAAPAPAAAVDDDDDDGAEEKTSAINLADIDMAAIDAMRKRPAPAAPAPAAAPPARPAPAPAAAARPAPAPAAPPKAAAPPPARAPAPAADDDDDDDGEEKTSAVDLDAIKAAMAARPARPAPAPAPAPAPKPEPAPAAKAAAPAPAPKAAAPTPRAPAKPSPMPDEGAEKTAAIDLDSFDLDSLSKPPAATVKVSAPSALKASAPAPKASPKAAPADDDGFERTMAVNLDDLQPPPGKGKARGPAATFLGDEDVPEVKAPPGKKLPGPGGTRPPAADDSEPVPTLFIKAGPDAGKSHPVARDLSLVGRGLDADIVINDASASRRHFNIVRTLSGWKLVDLGSGNGTKVNGSKVPEIALEHGMIIEAGGSTIEWRLEGSTAAAAGRGGPKHRSALFSEGGGANSGAGGRGNAAPPPADEGEGAEKTSFADIAALELDPKWEARKVAQRKEKDASEEMVPVSGGFDEAPVEARSSGGGAGKKIAVVGAIVAVLGGGFVAADKFGGLGIIFEKEKPAKIAENSDDGDEGKGAGGDNEATAKPAADAKKAAARKEAETAVREADDAMTAGKLFEARAKYSLAVEIDDATPGAIEGMGDADAKVKALKALVSSTRAFDVGDWKGVATTLADAKKSPVEKDFAKRFNTMASPLVAVELVIQTTAALEAGKASDARPVMEKFTALGLESDEAKAFGAVVDKALSKDADMRHVEEGDDGPVSAVPATAMKTAFEAWARGDDAALQAFLGGVMNEGSASVRDVAWAKALNGAATAFNAALAEAKAKLASGEFDAALAASVKAMMNDAMFNRGRAAQVDAVMIDVAAGLGKAAAVAGDNHLAALWSKYALRLKPDQADAMATVAALAPKASELGTKAKANVESAPDGAVADALQAVVLSAAGQAADAEGVLTALLGQ